MSTHWAELDSNNVVLRVVVGIENEEEALNWLEKSLGGRWLRTSFTGNIRKNFATVGGEYLPEFDVFISAKPEAGEWELDTENFTWIEVNNGTN